MAILAISRSLILSGGGGGGGGRGGEGEGRGGEEGERGGGWEKEVSVVDNVYHVERKPQPSEPGSLATHVQ